MIFLRLGLFIFGVFLLPLSAFAADNAPKPLSLQEKIYSLLKLPPDASEAEVKEAYESMAAQKLSAEERVQIDAVYNILITPNLKEQIDSGKADIEVTIPPEKRKDIFELLQKSDPEKASRLLTTGKVTWGAVQGALYFYFAQGIMEYLSCYNEEDPTPCKGYIEGLKDPNGHIGMAIFMATAQLASAAGMGNSVGAGAGTLFQEIFTDIIHNEHFKEWQKAKKIKDPLDRDAKINVEKMKFFQDTFGNGEWWKEKTPTIAAIVATIGSMRLLAMGLGYSAKNVKGGCSRTFAFLEQVVEGSVAQNTKGLKGWGARSSAQVASMMIFLANLSVIDKPIHAVWDALTWEAKLKKLKKQITHPNADLDEEKMQALLDESEKLWERSRHSKLASMERILSAHQGDIFNYDKAVKKPFLFYSWFLAGFPQEGDEWETIRDNYYESDTTPKDIEKDKNEFLRAFFCGVDPSQSIQDDKDFYGMPHPFYFNAKVMPYRVVKDVDKNLCAKNTPSFRYRELMEAADFKEAFKEAKIDHELVNVKFRQQKLDDYHKRVDEGVVRIVETQIAPMYSQEIENLLIMRGKMRMRKNSEAFVAMINTKIEQAKAKLAIAERLAKYMKTPLNDREVPGDIFFEGLFEESNLSDWQKSIKYYNNFILH